MSSKYPVIRLQHGQWVIWRKLTGCRQFWQARNKATLQYVNLSDTACKDWTADQVKAFLDDPDNVAANAEERTHFMAAAIKRINDLWAER